LYIPRSVNARLDADAGDGNVLIVGDAGAGKSAVA
jgi:MoxR-like ATPase